MSTVRTCPHCATTIPPATRPISVCPACGRKLAPPTASVVRRANAVASTLAPSESPSQRDTASAVGTPSTSTKVGRFVVRKKLGAGAFGTVYRAFDPQLQRHVALKVPNAGVLDSPQRIERFLREARAAANLAHPHIVSVYDAGKDGDRYYIASAFIEGQSLADTIPDGGTDFRRAATLARELAEALGYAHGRGIVHRDVKPANCLVDEKDELHLADFGLAAKSDDSSEAKLTNDGAILGTPSYMAPEQAAGQQGEAKSASDQYAVGVVLYELLTGRTPFSGPPAVVIYNVLNTDPERPSAVRRRIPRDLETICVKAMAKRPHDRYPDCQSLADDLRRWLDDEPIAARRLSRTERAVRWVRKNPAAAGAGGLTGALALTVIAALTLWALYRQAERERMSAVAARAAAVDARNHLAGEQAIAEGARREAETARDNAITARLAAETARGQLADAKERLAEVEYGRTMQVAYEAWRDGKLPTAIALIRPVELKFRGWEWQYLNRLCDVELFTCEGHTDWVTAVGFSSDGSKIMSASKTGTAKLWDLATGTESVTLNGQMGDITVSFSLDGKRIVTGSENGTARVKNTDDGLTISTLEGHTGGIVATAFSPDGVRIVTGSRDGTARVWDATTGDQIHVLKGHNNWVYAASFSPDGKRIVTGSADRTARVWDAATGNPTLVLVGHNSWVYAAAFSPDGRRIVPGPKTGQPGSGTQLKVSHRPL